MCILTRIYLTDKIIFNDIKQDFTQELILPADVIDFVDSGFC